jgi:hypothetical protein
MELKQETCMYGRCHSLINCRECSKPFLCNQFLTLPRKSICPRLKSEGPPHSDGPVTGICKHELLYCKPCRNKPITSTPSLS